MAEAAHGFGPPAKYALIFGGLRRRFGAVLFGIGTITDPVPARHRGGPKVASADFAAANWAGSNSRAMAIIPARAARRTVVVVDVAARPYQT